MLTPGRKSRRSILTPSRSSSRVASPAPIIERTQIISETTQYKLQTVPQSIHSVARDVMKRRRVTQAGLSAGLGFVCEGNRVIVWPLGGNKMFELVVPNVVFSVHITEDNGAVITTVKGEVVRWSRVDQPQRYTVQQNPVPCPVVHTTLHSDNTTLLLLDSSRNVWRCDQTTLTHVNASSALGGISRRVSSMFWTAPETLLGEANKIVCCGDVMFIVGTVGIQRIHGSLVTWTTDLKALVSSSSTCLNILDAVSVEGTLKCLVDIDGVLQITTLSAQHTSVPCSVDSVIQLQTDDLREARMLLKEGSEVGLLYNAGEAHIVTTTSGVTIPIQLDSTDILCAALIDGDTNLLTKQHGMLRLVVKDVKAAISNLNISTSEDSEYRVVEKKLLGAFKCFIEFNAETQEQAKLQDILGTDETALINKILSETGDYLLTAGPAADPRWGGDDVTLPVTLGLQIDERIKRLKGLVQFVVATGYYEYLTVDNDIAIQLLQHVEKCLVAKVFCNSSCALLRRAISETAAQFKSNNNQVSSEDVIFSNIDRIELVYWSLASGQNSVLANKSESEAVIQDLFLSVETVQQTFDVVHAWRVGCHQLYKAALKDDMVTWADTDDIRTMLTAQVHIALETVLPEVDEEGRYQVLLVTASIVESVLKLYQDLLDRMPKNDNRTTNLLTEYERRRHDLVQPFVELKLYQIAFSLAEQFQYYTLLVQLCEETNDMVKLRTFSATHPAFAEVAYNWYLQQGKESRLLTANVADPHQLSHFLTSQPHLKWLHQLGAKEYATAGKSLADLAQEEKESLSRKKTLLSISKLSLLADGQPPDTGAMKHINRQLETITHQERMKPEIIENAGLLAETMAPISCTDLVRLCVGDYNTTVEDLDVKKALDLLQYVAEDEAISNGEFERLRLDVWEAVISRDEWWDKCHLATPHQIDQTLFYRAVILAYNTGLLVSHFLPTVEQLLARDKWRARFQDQDQFKQFEYILRSGYEQMVEIGVVSR